MTEPCGDCMHMPIPCGDDIERRYLLARLIHAPALLVGDNRIKGKPKCLREARGTLLEPVEIQVDDWFCFGEHKLQIHFFRESSSSGMQRVRVRDLQTRKHPMCFCILCNLQLGQ